MNRIYKKLYSLCKKAYKKLRSTWKKANKKLRSAKKKINKWLCATWLRNRYSMDGTKSKAKQINLEWWSAKLNLGDTLSKVVFHWMLEQKGCASEFKTPKTIHFLGIGSIIGLRTFDAVIWGSGIHTLNSVKNTFQRRKSTKYDVRAVRGPVTKAILESFGYDCKNVVYGDPAIVMPKIYSPKPKVKKYKCTLILHWATKDKEKHAESYHCISIQTDDYESFIDEIVASELIVSSSLHGIILAETYGVPAVFLNENGHMNSQLMKFYDWYFSTGRSNVIIAHSVEEALRLTPMELPALTEMREALIAAFPYDLWGKENEKSPAAPPEGSSSGQRPFSEV